MGNARAFTCPHVLLPNSGQISGKISLDLAFPLGTDPSPVLALSTVEGAQDDGLLMALSPKVHGLLHAIPIGCSKETKQDSSLLLKVSWEGMGKQAAGKGFKKQVGL